MVISPMQNELVTREEFRDFRDEVFDCFDGQKKYIQDGFGKVFEQIDTLEFQLSKRIDDFRRETIKRFDSIDKKFVLIDKRFDLVGQKFDSVDKRFDVVDQKLGDVNSRLDFIQSKIDDVSIKIALLTKVITKSIK